MNDDELSQQITALYDSYVLAAGDEVKISEAREGVRADVIQLLAGTDRDLEAEADRWIQTTITNLRRKRSASLREQLDYILDGFGEDGTYVDPLLDQAFSLGDVHGIDKALRYWQERDFRDLVVTRYRVAAETTKAASAIDDTAQRCIDRMHASGAETFGAIR